MSPFILLSFDVEEFDTPLEFGQEIPLDQQMAVSRQGLERVLELLERLEIRATFFTTACFAQEHETLIRAVAQRHEIASHGFYHGRLADGDLRHSRLELERIIGAPVSGFRRARMAATDQGLVRAAGYTYNSSENPTWIPGRYNNFFQRRTAYLADGLLNIPASVTPLVRFPLFWLSFKNFPLGLVQRASACVLRYDGYLNTYFHPWEFVDLSAYRVPGYVKRLAGAPLVLRLERYVRWLAGRGQFATFSAFEAHFRAAAASAAPGGPAA